MKKFYLMGDLLVAGIVAVEAETLDEAVEKAESGDFEVYDDVGKNHGFRWNGDEDSVQTEDA